MSQPFPTQTPYPYPPAPPAPARRRPWRGIVIAFVAFLVGLLVGSASGTAPAATSAPTAPPAVSVAPAAPAPVEPSAAATAPAPATAGTYGPGTYRLGHDIAPGDYVTDGPTGAIKLATWSRLSATDGAMDSIIASGVVEGPTTITIKSTDVAVHFTGQATWHAA
jgi:hypothetical protein